MIFSFEFTNNNAVFKWLQDLRMMSENECLCVLQAKSLMNKIIANKSAPLNPKIEQNTSSNNDNKSTTLTNLNASQNSLNSTIKLTQSISSVDTVTMENIDLHNDEDNVDEGDEGDDEFDENESYNETERVQGTLTFFYGDIMSWYFI